MRAWLDCSSGISGDKFLGALLDAGWSLNALRHTLDALDAPELVLTIEEVTRRGMSALHVSVTAEGPQPPRTWRDIRGLLEHSALEPEVRDGALHAFALLAQAEARVHGSHADDVHFHEVGAWDSIADIVGVSAGLAALDIHDLVVSPVAVGSGTVETEHGTLPVPAPATALLLSGVPTVPGDAVGELTTPTGAALVRAFASCFAAMPAMTVVRVGHGAGARELPIANVARLVLGEAPADHEHPDVVTTVTAYAEAVAEGPGLAEPSPAEAPRAAPTTPTPPAGHVSPTAPAAHAAPTVPAAPAVRPSSREAAGDGITTEKVAILETNLDHLTAEHLAFACERLLEAGALDVWRTPIVMKKGRAAVALSVMTAPDDARRLAALVIDLTGALGVRRTLIERDVVPRRSETVKTSLGVVRVKVAFIAGKVRVRPEHDDVAAIALREGLPYDEVARLIAAEAEAIVRW